jgi:hypothetical protein
LSEKACKSRVQKAWGWAGVGSPVPTLCAGASVTEFTHQARTADTHPWQAPFTGLMETTLMSFTLRELRDDELEKVSGGLDAGKNEVAIEGAVSVEFQKKHITKFKFEPTSF